MAAVGWAVFYPLENVDAQTATHPLLGTIGAPFGEIVVHRYPKQ